MAEPFAMAICRHLRVEDKQTTSRSSAFLDACRQFNAGEIERSKLLSITEARGFNNVIDAFHIVAGADVPDRFFHDERGTSDGVRVTDNFNRLLEAAGGGDIGNENEARWRLVETAWRLEIGSSMLATYEETTGALLLPDRHRRRTSVTSSRAALNGYQQGRCFYCSSQISTSDLATLADVDHFFPHTLKRTEIGQAVDGVWNLVLACRWCNRGSGGKFDKVPAEYLLERLHARNEFLIGSHHPLRETLIMQTGLTEGARRSFLRDFDGRAVRHLVHRWRPT
ncbi:hypothetical protein WG922_16770 [Ramlibacter sp. AN1015]|uniref:hypothetical protein n=1 Tax=Ramlibacter sp. AN1015 TaxID=3133428 RepID=UPI0030C1D3CF